MTITSVREVIPESQPEIIYPSGDLYSDEPPLESDLHFKQIILLLACLDWLWPDREDYFASGNLTIYYSSRQSKSEQYRGPDFFVVLETTKKARKSWVVWEEDGKYPHVIIEILSPSTANNDRIVKKKIYQDTFRTPNYFWFDPESLEFQGFTLVGGKYEAITPNEQGWLWSDQLGLYLGIYNQQLRYFTPEGELVPTPKEAAKQEKQRADMEHERAEQERENAFIAQQRAEQERENALIAQQRAEQERENALIAQQRAEQERENALIAQQRAEQEHQRAEQLEARLRSLGIELNDL